MPTIIQLRDHRPTKVDYFAQDSTRPKLYERFPSERFIGLKTMRFANVDYGAEYDSNIKRYVGGERTNMVALDVPSIENTIVLDARSYEHSLEAMFDALFDPYAETEKNPSRTKQREVREQSERGRSYRDGRRQYIKPIVVIAQQLENDIINLIGSHEQFRTAIMVGAKSKIVEVGKYKVEIASFVPNGSAPSFEFYIRHDKRIMRIIGRDLYAYLKLKMQDAVKWFLNGDIEELDKTWLARYWESFTPDELDIIKKYAASNAHATRLLYEELTNFLVGIDPHVISSNGLIPKSAPTASMRIAQAQADEEQWSKPSRRIMQMGAIAYAGPRVFGVKPGYYEHVNQWDQTSQYPYILTQIAGPNNCEYIDTNTQPFDLERWKGKYGIICISGNGLDDHFPAIREHDMVHQRLRYIHGPFDHKWTTIQETVIGVVSGRLQVDEIHGGIQLAGDPEKSYLARHAKKMFAVKDQYEEGSPKYNIAKLLANAPSGKMAESNKDHRYIDPLLGYINVPIESYKEYEYLEQALVSGNDQFEEAISEIFKESKDRDEVVHFSKVFKYHTDFNSKAGAHYLPFHAAMVTGMGSAMLGLISHYTHAIIGHTDSIFVIGDATEGLAQYRATMAEAGYPVPESGMGAFRLKAANAKGWLAHGGLFSIKVQQVDKSTGEVVEVEKSATHGMVHIGDQTAYTMIGNYIRTGQTTYLTTPYSVKLKESFVVNQIAGTIRQQVNTLHSQANPNMVLNENGDRVWEDYQTLVSKSLNHKTSLTQFQEDILEDANKYLANSALNST